MVRSRRSRGRSLVASLMSLTLVLPSAVVAPAVLAQDATPEGPAPTETFGVDLEPVGEPTAFCGVLTPEEASAALGVTVTIGSSSETDCSWDSDYITNGLTLVATRDVGDFEFDAREIFPDGSLLEVGGRPAWYTPEGLALFVDLGDSMMFTIELYGLPPDGLDVETALTELASLALPRLAEVPIPTEAPEPSFQGDPVLQALIPTMVGEVESIIDVYTARDLMSEEPDDPGAASSMTELDDLVSAHGKSVDDVSFATADFATETAYGDLFAVRVAGADVASFQDELIDLVLQLNDPHRTPATIAGKAVTVVTEGPPPPSVDPSASPDPSAEPYDDALPPSYIYASGDVLFIVSADEPQLTLVFEQLP